MGNPTIRAFLLRCFSQELYPNSAGCQTNRVCKISFYIVLGYSDVGPLKRGYWYSLLALVADIRTPAARPGRAALPRGTILDS